MLPTHLLYHTASQIIMNLEAIASEIRNFEGVTRKKSIADIAEILGTVRSEYTDCIADRGRCAAICGGRDMECDARGSMVGRIRRSPCERKRHLRDGRAPDRHGQHTRNRRQRDISRTGPRDPGRGRQVRRPDGRRASAS